MTMFSRANDTLSLNPQRRVAALVFAAALLLAPWVLACIDEGVPMPCGDGYCPVAAAHDEAPLQIKNPRTVPVDPPLAVVPILQAFPPRASKGLRPIGSASDGLRPTLAILLLKSVRLLI